MGVIAWFKKVRQWRRDHVAAFAAAVQREADGLTLFQVQVIAAVSRFVPAASFERSALNKEPGVFLSAPLGSAGSELFVYPNEAAILGAKPYAWFEEWDYRTPEDLLHALVEECAARAA